MIETRFTPEHGYLVESQRGGGGFIRIIRLLDDKQRTLLEAARGIGGRLSQNDAARLTRALVSAELLTQREGQLLLSAARTVRWRRLIKPTATDCVLRFSDAQSWALQQRDALFSVNTTLYIISQRGVLTYEMRKMRQE